MNVLEYAMLSGLVIMLWQLAFNIRPVTFGLLQMVGVFILGGVIGYYMSSLLTGLLMSIAFSLIFI